MLPMISNSPLKRPPLGFEKINIDLRQVPKNFIKLTNIEYMFLAKKVDKLFLPTQRKIFILHNYWKLENSFGKRELKTEEDEISRLLKCNYSLENLEQLTSAMQNALEGPNGEAFFEQEYDFLGDIAFMIWKNYLNPVLV